MSELEATIQGLRVTSARDDTLVLSCERSVAMRWLIPRLGAFERNNPDVALHLSVGGGQIDFRRDRTDLAIRRLDFALPESWHVRRLFAEKVGPVMAPNVVPEFEQGKYIGLGSRTRPDAWSHWLSNSLPCSRPSEIRFHDHHFLMVEAASAGLGVALCPLVLATDDIQKGRLIAPLGFKEDGSNYGVIWLGDRELSLKEEGLIAWLERECTLSFGQVHGS